MATLFEKTRINGMELANRFVASATNLEMAEKDGSCTPALVAATARLARENVGLIVTGFAYVAPGGRVTAAQLGCYDDRLLPGLKQMAQAVHEAGGTVVVQIEHGGVFSSFGDPTGEEALGPSPLPTPQGPLGRAMTKDEIRRTVEAFAAAAARAKKAGFDGVQIHAAHGFLLSQFLSPFFNKRTDEYGGSLENRARMLMEVFAAVKSAVGGRFPVLVKLNSEDLLDGGFTKEKMLDVCAMLERGGIDAIEMSGGTALGVALNKPEISFSPTGEAVLYWRQAAEMYRKQIKAPLILVGGVRTLEAAQRIVESGLADYVSLSRPLIREPDLVGRWKRGDLRPAECVSDNLCMGTGRCAHVAG